MEAARRTEAGLERWSIGFDSLRFRHGRRSLDGALIRNQGDGVQLHGLPPWRVYVGRGLGLNPGLPSSILGPSAN